MEQLKPFDDARSQTTALLCICAMVLVFGVVGVFGYGAYRFTDWANELRWISQQSICCFQGEIVFARAKVDFTTGPHGPCRMFAFDPNNGRVRELGIDIPAMTATALTDGNRLWIVGPKEVVEYDGHSVMRFDTDCSTNPLMSPFLLDGRPAAIIEGVSGFDFVYRFEEGNWRKDFQIALPGVGRTWTSDRDESRRRMIPRTSKVSLATAGGWEMIRAAQVGDTVHLVAHTFGPTEPTSAYRVGWDKIDDSMASALAPSNDLPDTTGWSRLQIKNFQWQPFPINFGKQLFMVTVGEIRLWKQIDGKPEKFEPAYQRPSDYLGQPFPSYVAIAASTDELYSVEISQFQSMKIYRLTGRRFEPLPFIIPGNAEWMIGIKRTMIRAIVAVFFVANLVLLAGAARLARRWKQSTYSFGHEIVELAPLLRRWIARLIDLVLIVSPWLAIRFYVLAHYDSEQRLVSQLEVIVRFQISELWKLWGPMFVELFPLPENQLFAFSTIISYTAAVAWAFLFWAVLAAMEGRTGATFGKWCCGIRVVRSTLRPCGEARSLLRELLLPVESICFLFPIPAVSSILLTDSRQRWGDISADTIVIINRTKRSVSISSSLDLEAGGHGHPAATTECAS